MREHTCVYNIIYTSSEQNKLEIMVYIIPAGGGGGAGGVKTGIL